MTDLQQRVFFALSDETRRQILEWLSTGGEKTPTQLADELPITRQGVTKHLNILAEAELVIVRQAGREKRYRLSPQPLSETVTWVDRVVAKWDERLQALKDFLMEEMDDANKSNDDPL